MRTWGDGAAGDGYYDLVFVAGLKLPLDVAAFRRRPARVRRSAIARGRCSSATTKRACRRRCARVAALASERAAAAPLRTWIGLPAAASPACGVLCPSGSFRCVLRRWVCRGIATCLPLLTCFYNGLALIGAGRLLWASRARPLPDAATTLAALTLPAILRSAMYAYLIGRHQPALPGRDRALPDHPGLLRRPPSSSSGRVAAPSGSPSCESPS